MPQRTAKLSMLWLIIYNLTGKRLQLNSAHDPVGLLRLVTTGRKSGRPREVSLVYIKSGPAYVVAASNAGRDTHPGWYFNLLANPQVLVRIKQQQIKAMAEVASPEQRNLLWEQLVTAASMYARYTKQTHREIPLILLHPQE